MRFPTVILEGKKLPRMIFSILPPPSLGDREIYRLMEKTYELGAWCFDLPSANHLESFKEFKNLTGDESLIGLCHIEPEAGLSFLGKPLHRFESRMVSTIRKVLPPDLLRNVLLPSSSSEVLTQKEIDRICLDLVRFDKAVSLFDPKDSPFLLVGEKYGDWLLALGRIDLLHGMVSGVREKGFIPIFAGQWTTFTLPKAKSLNVAAFAIPINKKSTHSTPRSEARRMLRVDTERRSLPRFENGSLAPSNVSTFFDPVRTSDLIKKFDKPVISLNPLAAGKPLREPEEAFSFLFDELKVYAAIVQIASEDETKRTIEAITKFPSLIPPRKT